VCLCCPYIHRSTNDTLLLKTHNGAISHKYHNFLIFNRYNGTNFHVAVSKRQRSLGIRVIKGTLLEFNKGEYIP
jgi:hypothetical protein